VPTLFRSSPRCVTHLLSCTAESCLFSLCMRRLKRSDVHEVNPEARLDLEINARNVPRAAWLRPPHLCPREHVCHSIARRCPFAHHCAVAFVSAFTFTFSAAAAAAGANAGAVAALSSPPRYNGDVERLRDTIACMKLAAHDPVDRSQRLWCVVVITVSAHIEKIGTHIVAYDFRRFTQCKPRNRFLYTHRISEESE
jgi:hypothetical protein